MANMIGDLVIKISADITAAQAAFGKLATGMHGVTQAGDKLFSSAGLMAAGVIAGATAMAVHFAQTSEEIENLAIKTGLTAEQIQEFGYAAKITGASLGDLETSTKRMQVAISELGQGTQKSVDEFAKLGLSFEQLKTKNPGEQLKIILAAISKLPEQFDRTNAAVAIFGRGGTALLPMATRLQELIDKAHKLGIILSDEDVKAGADFNDVLVTMQVKLEAAAGKIAAKFAPELAALGEKLIIVIGQVVEFILKNEGLVRVMLEVAIAIAAVALAFKLAAIAEALFQALSGPAGWAALAIGAAVAVVAIAKIETAWNDATTAMKNAKAAGVATVPSSSSVGSFSGGGGGTSRGHGASGGWASGGVFTKPTYGLIGEAGPEAVIPLSKMGGMGGTNVTIQAGAFMGSREDARNFARMLQEIMRNENNTRTYGRLV